MTDRKTATLVRQLDDFNGDAALYRMTPPHEGHEYVIASAVVLTYEAGCETYLFASSESGEIADWLELDGSLKNTLSHDDALNAAGYEVVR